MCFVFIFFQFCNLAKLYVLKYTLINEEVVTRTKENREAPISRIIFCGGDCLHIYQSPVCPFLGAHVMLSITPVGDLGMPGC